jgi:hypothetical protein
MTDLRQQIQAALRDFDSYPLPDAATRLFATLGYKSDRVLPMASVADFCTEWDQGKVLTPREREALDQLTAFHFLFQLTDTELTLQRDLMDQGNAVDGTRIHSYLFFAAELPPGIYTRTLLASIARAINKPLPMPALVLLRHGDRVSLAVIHRRLNKRQSERDVLEKATLIKDIAYLEPTLSGDDPAGRLRTLFAAPGDDYAPDLDEAETSRLVAALDGVKILDPACGSGAYPMGALHRLVDLLRKLDPENKLWETRQRARLTEDKAKAGKLEDEELRQEALAGVARREAEFKALFNVGRFDRDYARKLFLIENAIFGSDIQPVAVQIAKLRFFIALICDQKTDPKSPNQGVLPLPNLETRIVAANTLMPIPEMGTEGHVADLFDSEVRKHRSRLQEVRHEHFSARHPATKRRCRDKDAKIRKELADLLQREAHLDKKVAKMLADWDPYDQNDFAPFFDPAWMFGDAYLRGAKASEAGFDIAIANPPYVRQEKIKDQKDALKPYYPDTFTGTADLYVYFYDRALQLLRSGGILSYISSNKWYRAAYGEKLRAHLGATTSLIHAIDFGDAPIFTANSASPRFNWRLLRRVTSAECRGRRTTSRPSRNSRTTVSPSAIAPRMFSRCGPPMRTATTFAP